MPFLNNAHTHSTYCDGKNPIRAMIDAACQAEFVSLGFSGHASQNYDFDYCMSRDNQRAYFDELHALQKEPLPLRLWDGLEVDALIPEDEMALTREADYTLGSAHYLHAVYGGEGIAVDGDPVLLKAHIDSVYSGDGLAALRHYYDIFVDFLLSYKPDIIGHFDLPRKYAQKLNLFDESSPIYRRLVLDALERAFPSGSVLEVNTGGMARGYLDTPYPTLELLCAWREMGGKVTITSDCHDCRYLTHAFDMAERMIHEAGFQSVMRLGAADALWEEIGL